MAATERKRRFAASFGNRGRSIARKGWHIIPHKKRAAG